MKINLLPSDFQINSRLVSCVNQDFKVSYDTHVSITTSHEIDIDNGESVVKRKLLGYIELKCLITNRYVNLPIYEEDGYTVHSINQTQLIRAFDNASLDSLIFIKHSKDYSVTCKEEKIDLFTDASMKTFAIKHTTVTLIDDVEPTGNVLHTFFEGIPFLIEDNNDD